MLIVLGFLIVGVVGICLEIVGRGYDGIGCFIGVLLLVLLSVFYPVAFGINSVNIKQMKINRDINIPNVKVVINRTLSYLDVTDKTDWGLEKAEAYRAVSERQAELNNIIKEYNVMLAGYRWYKSNIFLNWFVPNIDDFDYIELK